ncbi:MAG: hypothetical protein PW791_15720 [Neorhizobium sp.]|jgi:UDP-N-acetyl-D-mannosaminuronic acid transferase (WecB/TagA/CpsF family)|nr:hypothetical protein [Neorhizobium sp.]
MEAPAQLTASDRRATAPDPQICDLGWSGALALADSLIGREAGRSTLAFLDDRAAIDRVLDGHYRAALRQRLLIDARRFAAGPMRGPRTRAASLTAARFIPALLTFLDRPCRVGLAGRDPGRLERLKLALRRHTPWHEFSVVSPAELPTAGYDLVIVDAVSPAEERLVERQLVGLTNGLLLMGGRSLSALVPAAERSRRHRKRLPAAAGLAT